MRLAKGQEISKGKNIERISERSYIVKSQSGNGSYDVYYTELGFICSCPDHMYRGVKCKHIHAVEFSFALREQVKKEIVISHIDTKLCPQCQSSKIVKHGIRHNRYGDVQRFYCNDCSKWFCFNLGFEKTRFWIAQQVADTKYTANINPLFHKGKQVTGKRPNTLISDGAPNFNDSFNREFYTNTAPRTRHIRHIRLQGDHNNNRMERFNGEVRDREKTMRGLKKTDTPILSGYQIYHNYVRPHEGLDGKTPAEKCGIKIEGNNKWITLIQRAKNASSFKE